MYRIAASLLLAAVALPAAASASSWHSFSSKVLGFSVQYPAGWKVLQSASLHQVSIQHSGKSVYSVTVAVLPIKPAVAIPATMTRARAYERRIGNTTFASIRWQGVSIGGRAARGGVLLPPTEGGVPVANGIYILASHTHVYEVTVVAFGKPAVKTLGQFPNVYRQILGTWRYL